MAGRGRARSWGQRAILTAGCAFVAVCLGGVSLAGYTLAKYGSIERYKDLHIDEAPAGDPENYLVVGSDTRAGASAEEARDTPGQRSDTIMIVRIDPGEEQALVLSLPRDLVVPIAGTGETGRINSAYSMGTPDQGRQRLINTIRENFGIPINHYVEISFQGFGRLVDAVGGIRLYFRTAVRDLHSGFYQEELGCQTLNGERALQFVRSRYLDYMTPDHEWRHDGSADLGRITRQQVFIREAVRQIVAEVGSNPLKINRLIDIGIDTIGLDEDSGIGDIRDLADRFRDFSDRKLRTYALPVVDRADHVTVALVERDAEPILNVFRGLAPGEISPSVVKVTVLNGTGRQGQANDVAGALQAIGFDVVGKGDLSPAGATVAHTQVRHAPGDEAYGQRVASHITGGADLAVNPALDPGSVEVVTGLDFTTVHDQPTPVEQTSTTTTAAGSSSSVSSTTTTTRPTTTTTATLPPSSDPTGHSVGEIPAGAHCG
jgi:polyisoprenyl-teichoic acid--peptidoglycan teichoic acid transferase